MKNYDSFLKKIKKLPLCEQIKLIKEYKRTERLMKRSELNNKIIKYITNGVLVFVLGVIGFGLLKWVILTILK